MTRELSDATQEIVSKAYDNGGHVDFSGLDAHVYDRVQGELTTTGYAQVFVDSAVPRVKLTPAGKKYKKTRRIADG
ncbi:MAG: hypothetical protein KJ718_02470 [Nanoarchaeota archaeon]|nr:hypothetical protein [Nanoarchaeota archaeon]MBU1051395.1 hypothetical protein [Nanoarchaeota archaeon]